MPGTAQSKWELFDGIISRAQGGPRDRRGTAISCSESPQCPRNQIECPSWRYWPSLSPSRRRGGAARAGPRRAGRRIRAQQPDPPAGSPPDGVRRRWGAGSAPGRTGQRRAAALPHVAPPPRRCQGGHSCWFLGHFGDYGRVMAVPRRSRGTLSALLIICAKRAHLRFAVPGTSWR